MIKPLEDYANAYEHLCNCINTFDSPYQKRLLQVLADRFHTARDQGVPLFLIAPPGFDGESLVAHFVKKSGIKSNTLDCRIESGDIEPIVASMGSDLRILLYPEHLPAEQCSGMLEHISVAADHPCIVICTFPPWPSRPRRKPNQLLDFRDFCYRNSDIEYLLATTIPGSAAKASASADIVPFDLLRLTGGWPGLTEAWVVGLAATVLKEPQAEGRRGGSLFIAPTPVEVRRLFETIWLPLLLARHRWIIEACALPMLSLDLLVHLYPDVAPKYAECRGMGLLQLCRRQPGFYQVNVSLEGLLLSTSAEYRDGAIMEKAARWYEQQGYVSEAIECLVTLGVKEDILSSLQDRVSSKSRRRIGSSASSRSLANLGPAAGVARATLGPLRPELSPSALKRGSSAKSIAASKNQRETALAEETDNPLALTHIMSAYHHHRDNNAVAVASAIAAAVESGVDHEHLSTLIDFIDVHIRPLVRDGQGPLSFALKDIRHSAPAREAVAAQLHSLNHREMQILQRICEGYKNREISEQLGLELSTIKWYSTRIYEKLQVRNRTQAVARAQVLQLFG